MYFPLGVAGTARYRSYVDEEKSIRTNFAMYIYIRMHIYNSSNILYDNSLMVICLSKEEEGGKKREREKLIES